MNKTPAAMAGVSVHGSEPDPSTRIRPPLKASPVMRLRLEALRFNAPPDGGNAEHPFAGGSAV